MRAKRQRDKAKTAQKRKRPPRHSRIA
jgi:hypothetical protein